MSNPLFNALGGRQNAGRDGAISADDAAVSAVPAELSGRPEGRGAKAAAIGQDEPAAAQPAASDGAAV